MAAGGHGFGKSSRTRVHQPTGRTRVLTRKSVRMPTATYIPSIGGIESPPPLTVNAPRPQPPKVAPPPALCLKLTMSRKGGAPNLRLYSRLNWDGLSYPT